MSRVELSDEYFYPNIFLGRYAKRTGVLYYGLDDFELLLPKYDTDYTWIAPQKGFTKYSYRKS